MIVTAKAIAEYRDTLRRISEKAADEVQQYMMDHHFEIDETFIGYVDAIVTKYGEAAGSLSAQFYDNLAEYWRKVQNGDSPYSGVNKNTLQMAEVAELPSSDEVAKAVYGTMKESPNKIPSTVGRLVKRTAEDTTLKNAIRDGAQFAWVPNGDTCPFCIMLASRGWQYASKKALKNGHAEHIHPNCDCTYVVRFDSSTNVVGYDPDKYLKMYNEAGGDLNALRREIYHRVKNEPTLIKAENPFKHPKTPLTIAKDNQSKHIVGGKKYIEYMKTHEYEPSIILLKDEEIQALVDKYHGTGILKLDKNGNVISSEMIVDNNMIIGYAVNNNNGQKVTTSGFKIHYSKDGTHIVPMYENQKEYWKKRREQNGNDWLLRQKG